MWRARGAWSAVLVSLLAMLLVSSPAPALEAPDREVRFDDMGPVAYRERADDGGWRLPSGDAVLIDEAWWSPLHPLEPARTAGAVPDRAILQGIREHIAPIGGRSDRLTAVALGDVTQDGRDELVVSFRRPFRRTTINATRPRSAWVDDHGLSAHLGLYRPDDLSQVWVAGTLVSPVVELAACDGALAVAYGDLADPGVVETGAWRWVVFGFLPTPPLPGPGTPTCVDIDGDGRTEPAVIGRSTP